MEPERIISPFSGLQPKSGGRGIPWQPAQGLERLPRVSVSPGASVREISVLRVNGRDGALRPDALAMEEPLEIQLGYESRGWRVHKSVSITMRTPGNDAELAAGFLFSEGILNHPAEQLEAIEILEENVVRAELRSGVDVDLQRLERHFYTSSSCGVCGKTSIAALGLQRMGGVLLADPETPLFDAGLIHRLPDLLRETQALFARTGGLHAAALFDAAGRLIALREDVGRHNAVDKLIGSQILNPALRRELATRLLFVSGRASFELMQKALAAGIPILAAVGAPSSLAVDLARQHGATLLGFVRNDRFNLYSGEKRITGLECFAPTGDPATVT